MSQLAEKIAQEIRRQGPIPFARFMDLALYCPVYGYYEKEEDTIGRGGDYYTSVSVGSLFGQLLACQFAEWLGEGRGAQPRVQLVEAGAHRGELARDILRWLREQRLELFARLEYWILEPSARRRQWQETTLAEFASQVHWASAFAEFPAPAPPLRTSRSGGVCGVIFSNELLDAFPVQRLGWDAERKAWFEWGVGVEADQFVWTRLPAQPEAKIQEGLPQDAGLLAALPDGFTMEVCPGAVGWWQAAASVLECGKLVTIDYGLSSSEVVIPERQQGTLRAYYQHRASDDLLAHPGDQDLTAHVNFSALQAVGEAGGLDTEALLGQDRFLTQIAARIWRGELAFGEWLVAHTRQFQTLTHPDHLGRGFRVLVQSKLPRQTGAGAKGRL
jgi:SAM-dependent MidA family methyltransferase